MQEPIIDALESTRGYIDGFIADVKRSSIRGEDALDYITAARRLRLKALDVLNETVIHAAHASVPIEDIAARYGLTVEEVEQRYPEIADIRRRHEETRRAFGDGGF